MKRLLVLLCVWGLLSGVSLAQAETVQEQVNAPASIQADFYSNTQKSLVSVHAQVYLPDTDAIFLRNVAPRDFNAVELWSLAESILPNTAWHPEAEYQALQAGELLHFENQEYSYVSDSLRLYADAVPLADGGTSMGTAFLINSFFRTPFGIQPSERTLRYEAADGYNHPHFYTSIDSVDSLGKDIEGQSTTFAQARELAQALVAQVCPSFSFQLGGASSGEVCYHKEGTEEYRNAAYKTPAYCFVFSRVVEGVTITYENTYMHVAQMRDVAMAAAPNTERVTVVVHNGRIVIFEYENPYGIGEAQPDACQLLPFDKIMEIFGTIAPLSIQNMENENAVMGGANNLLDITEIRLGYMPVLKKDDPNQWVLRPVWDFFGTRRFAHENYAWPCQSRLTIDAIDGTVIDRSYGY